MSIINDAITAIETWFKGVLAGGIESSLNTVNSMLSGSLHIPLFLSAEKKQIQYLRGTRGI